MRLEFRTDSPKALGGKAKEAGICYSRLAHLLKHIGPFEEAALAGQKAVFYLRQSDDKRELSEALRQASVPFVGTSELDYLRESLALAREIGDREQEAWTIYRYTRALTPPVDLMNQWKRLSEKRRTENYRAWVEEVREGHAVEEALAIFEEIGDAAGIATCLVSLGIERKPHDRAHFDRAIELFRQIGDEKSVSRTHMMANAFAPQG